MSLRSEQLNFLGVRSRERNENGFFTILVLEGGKGKGWDGVNGKWQDIGSPTRIPTMQIESSVTGRE
jgi:hypothetical protein